MFRPPPHTTLFPYTTLFRSRGKGTIEDHFDCATELEDTLRRNGKRSALAAVESSGAGLGTIAYIRQQEPLGLVHALWCARDRKSTRLNSSHPSISYAVFCLK